jgi:hypothetical protein
LRPEKEFIRFRHVWEHGMLHAHEAAPVLPYAGTQVQYPLAGHKHLKGAAEADVKVVSNVWRRWVEHVGSVSNCVCEAR